ncbi:unnamed protein product [Paramecium sonneborni]|uniref:Tetratricopeptide repeat protein n=1 Tax=Paramecium sonneborni TaxID=65129 RepID=A0A8S1RQC5_9CILI|nr:unnamed protein product [Paramecium sonneborni]
MIRFKVLILSLMWLQPYETYKLQKRSQKLWLDLKFYHKILPAYTDFKINWINLLHKFFKIIGQNENTIIKDISIYLSQQDYQQIKQFISDQEVVLVFQQSTGDQEVELNCLQTQIKHNNRLKVFKQMIQPYSSKVFNFFQFYQEYNQTSKDENQLCLMSRNVSRLMNQQIKIQHNWINIYLQHSFKILLKYLIQFRSRTQKKSIKCIHINCKKVLHQYELGYFLKEEPQHLHDFYRKFIYAFLKYVFLYNRYINLIIIYDLNENELAISCIDKALQSQNSKKLLGFLQIGVSLQQSKVDYEKAIQLEPNHRNTSMNKGLNFLYYNRQFFSIQQVDQNENIRSQKNIMMQLFATIKQSKQIRITQMLIITRLNFFVFQQVLLTMQKIVKVEQLKKYYLAIENYDQAIKHCKTKKGEFRKLILEINIYRHHQHKIAKFRLRLSKYSPIILSSLLINLLFFSMINNAQFLILHMQALIINKQAFQLIYGDQIYQIIDFSYN